MISYTFSYLHISKSGFPKRGLTILLDDARERMVSHLHQQHQFTIFNYHVYRHGVYGVYIDIIILKVITIRHERIITRHKLGLKLDMSY